MLDDKSLYLQPFSAIDDTIIAMISGVTLFLIPTKESEKDFTLERSCEDAVGNYSSFVGGMAIAKGFEVSGLAIWIGSQISFIEQLNLFFMILVLVAFVNFLTEITSNLATTAMLLPILTSIALELGVHPYSLLVSTAIAASLRLYAIPVATPPNAVVFGSGYLKIKDMTRNGLLLNIFSIFLIVIMVYYMLPLLWGYKPSVFPENF